MLLLSQRYCTKDRLYIYNIYCIYIYIYTSRFDPVYIVHTMYGYICTYLYTYVYTYGSKRLVYIKLHC